MNTEDVKDLIADAAAAGVVAVAAYQSINLIAVPDAFNAVVGAAVAYLFIKHSPNTV